MAKPKTIYRCTECGYESAKWNGKCPSCGAWNTLEEDVPLPTQAVGNGRRKPVDLSEKIQELQDVDTSADVRYHTGVGELDRVLGGGLVRGSIVLLGGEPGIGKSTLLLQICQYFGEAHTVLYVSGEESAKQLKLRANRLGITSETLYVLAENALDNVEEKLRGLSPDVAVIDSIQTMYRPDMASAPGSVSQIRECTSQIMRLCKESGTAIFLVGHVTKDGAIAGPRMLEHMVDVVLYFEGDRHASYRILRGVKNRFGSTNEIGVFEMQTEGLVEVKNPSEYMLNGRPEGASGSVVACSMEGTRPILIEIQALVCHSNFGIPRRTAAGCDFNRVNLLMAVLEKRARVNLSTSDAYVNIAGGIKMNEPAIDLGIALAVVSSYKDQVIDEKTVVFGEVGLSGEVRAVSMAEQRVLEAKKLGFERVILPAVCMKSVEKIGGIALIPVENIQDAILRVGKN